MTTVTPPPAHPTPDVDTPVTALQAYQRVRLRPADAIERARGLQIVCPYDKCAAPMGIPCRRADAAGELHEMRLLHPIRIATARRLFTQREAEPVTARRALLTRKQRSPTPEPAARATQPSRRITPPRRRRAGAARRRTGSLR